MGNKLFLKFVRIIFLDSFVVTNSGSNVGARGLFHFAFCAISCAVSELQLFCTVLGNCIHLFRYINYYVVLALLRFHYYA
jgi:hypothetical protein